MVGQRVFYPQIALVLPAGNTVCVLELLVLPAGSVVRTLEPPVQCVGEGNWWYPLDGCQHGQTASGYPL